MSASVAAKDACKMPPPQILAAYGVFTLGAGTVWHLVADGEFSAIMTMAVMMQCLAIALLGLQMLSTGSAAGISAHALMLDAFAICCRLSSTLWLNGYLPVDASGDYVFQAVDICSLLLLLKLLHMIFVELRHTYNEEQETLPVKPLVVGALIMAALLHGNMNRRPLFDALWLASLFVSTVAVMPQLWLITKTGGRVEALTSHYIAVMAASRALSGMFMWHARRDITCEPWITGVNHTILAILGAHLLQILLLGDYGYYYIKAVLSHGLNCRLEMAEGCGV